MFRDLYATDPRGVAVTDRRPKRVRGEITARAVGGKGTPVYLAHSYPTKVPPEAIEPFIAHYTRPGDLVCDPFAGSGMTGVAARRLGRNAVLSDLSPLSVHVTTNVTTACDPIALREAAAQVVSKAAEALVGWYAATCTKCRGPGQLDWLVWGDTVQCNACSRPVRLWDSGFDPETGRMSGDKIVCPHCDEWFPRRGAHVIESAPVEASVTCLGECGRMERPPLHSDAARSAAIAESPIADWFPDALVEPDREMFIRSALALHGVFRITDFYTPRNLRALARLWAEIKVWPDHRVRQRLV